MPHSTLPPSETNPSPLPFLGFRRNQEADEKDRLRKIRQTVWIILAGFTVALTLAFWWGVCKHETYPYNTFLFKPSDRFMDFYNIYTLTENPLIANTPLPPGKPALKISYFPFAHLPFQFFILFNRHAMALLFGGGFILFFLFTCFQNLKGGGLARSLMCALAFMVSYPLLFSVDRLNTECLGYIYLYLFVYFHQRQQMNAAVLMLGMAIASKPFPAVFGLLLLADKNYKAILKLAVVVAALTLISYLFGSREFQQAIREIPNSWHEYHMKYVYGRLGFGFTHSLWTLSKYLVYLLNDSPAAVPRFIRWFETPYKILALAMLCWIYLHIAFRESVYWKKIALLVCAMNLLPQVSGDYKLLYLFIPYFLFLNSGRTTPRDNYYNILFALLFIPKAFSHLDFIPEANSAIALNALGMLLLTVSILSDPPDIPAENP